MNVLQPCVAYNILRLKMLQAPTTPHQECSQRTSPATSPSRCLVRLAPAPRSLCTLHSLCVLRAFYRHHTLPQLQVHAMCKAQEQTWAGSFPASVCKVSFRHQEMVARCCVCWRMCALIGTCHLDDVTVSTAPADPTVAPQAPAALSLCIQCVWGVASGRVTSVSE